MQTQPIIYASSVNPLQVDELTIAQAMSEGKTEPLPKTEEELQEELEQELTFSEVDSTFKAYMDYKHITNTSSAQWKLQQQATTKENVRFYENRVMVAIGTSYGYEVGDFIGVELDTGFVVSCVVGDIKSDQHTNDTNSWSLMKNAQGQLTYSSEGKLRVNVIEVIVDGTDEKMRLTGSVSHKFNLVGNVVSIVDERTQ